VPSKLGKYEIRRELGRGAMGIVYEGFDPFIERTVAIKTINKSLIDPSEVETVFSRFRREAQAAGRLTHPNIVSIYEYGEEGDVAFIAMERLAGVELQEYLNNGRQFEIVEIESLMTQLLDALEYSHKNGVIHRDIKPANILIAKDGSIKIADFGIAKIESTHLTTVGYVLGTPTYMSPEQYIGNEVDGRSDIYSAGVLLYQLLTGTRPFTGSNLTMVMQKVMHQPPVAPSEVKSSGITKVMDEVVKKALAKHPEDRFQTATDFKKALMHAVAATPAKSSLHDATVKLKSQNLPNTNEDLVLAVAYDKGEFEARLDEEREQFNNELKQAVFYKEPTEKPVSLNFNIPVADVAKKDIEEIKVVVPAPQSGLLASLALEASQSMQNMSASNQSKLARNRRVNESLSQVNKFFMAFNEHVNNVEPAINRTYRLDARSVYTNLKWQGALVDARKQSMSDVALLSHVAFSVNYVAPEPVQLKRPWGQFEALKKELYNLKLRSMDDLDDMHKRQKQEWLETRLDPALPVQIVFQGNYETGQIEVLTRNLADFGQAAFRLEPEKISMTLLDELGLFLIGRADKLPGLLRAAGK